MEHLNYCRQLSMQVLSKKIMPGTGIGDQLALLKHQSDLSVVAQKFIMPDNGVLFYDPELRAIDDSKEISLPYKIIALEFKVTNMGPITKSIVFAVQHDDLISIMQSYFTSGPGFGFWVAAGDAHDIPRVQLFQSASLTEDQIKKEKRILAAKDSANGLVLHLLNALACSNVQVERSEPKNSKKKVKSALPFDAYHILTVDVSCKNQHGGEIGAAHRSPREHLRRGHIRRLEDGRRIWVNAAIIGAGHGAGVITKDYMVKGSAR